MIYLLNPISAGITGFESPAAEYVQMSLNLNDILIQHPAATYFGRASGHSMVDAGIFHDDVLVISRAVKAHTGSVIVANLNGEFVCKVFDSERRVLYSANPKEKPYYLKEGDVFQIEGVVIRSIRLHEPLTYDFTSRL